MILQPSARVALYYAPQPDDPLWRAACGWLGRDPQIGEALTQPDFSAIAEITADPRRYGFHATLKPPMRLRPESSWEDVLADTAAVAAAIAPFDLPPLAVADLSGFLALRETAPCPALRMLADAYVAGLDAHRAPPDEAEFSKRRGTGLSPEREAMLLRWGYPDVFETWLFHMTLTCRLSDQERAMWQQRAEAWLGRTPHLPRRVTDVCLFVQPAPDAPFTIAARVPLEA